MTRAQASRAFVLLLVVLFAVYIRSIGQNMIPPPDYPAPAPTVKPTPGTPSALVQEILGSRWETEFIPPPGAPAPRCAPPVSAFTAYFRGRVAYVEEKCADGQLNFCTELPGLYWAEGERETSKEMNRLLCVKSYDPATPCIGYGKSMGYRVEMEEIGPSCAAGDPRSCIAEAAYLLSNGKAAKAGEILAATCKGGFWSACAALGTEFPGRQAAFAGNCAPRHLDSCVAAAFAAAAADRIHAGVGYLRFACAHADAMACGWAGMLEPNADGERTRARCAGGDALACVSEAMREEDALFDPRYEALHALAQRHLRFACGLGVSVACELASPTP